MERNHAPAAGTAVPAANAEALSSTNPSQEPQHLQNHSSTFNSPTPHTVPLAQIRTISGLEYPNSQKFSNESDGSTESSSDELPGLDEESEPENLEDDGDPAEAIPRAMRTLEQINAQIMEAEVDLGQQLLACKEPYHRIDALMQHFHVAHRSLNKIRSRVDGEEYHRISENYYFQQSLQNRKHEATLHPDREIEDKQYKIATIGRVFRGDPAGVLLDILEIKAYTAIMP